MCNMSKFSIQLTLDDLDFPFIIHIVHAVLRYDRVCKLVIDNPEGAPEIANRNIAGLS